MSWKPEMDIPHEGWRGNALRFATREEAEANAKDLFMRWTMPKGWRAVECDDPVNYRWADGKLEPVVEKTHA
jgi:hypothetical protein